MARQCLYIEKQPWILILLKINLGSGTTAFYCHMNLQMGLAQITWRCVQRSCIFSTTFLHTWSGKLWSVVQHQTRNKKMHIMHLLFSCLVLDNDTVKCHYNACHYNANASLTRSSLGSQTAPTCPHDHPRVAQHMGYRCEIIAVWSATAAMTPLCSHTNGIKQRYPTCWLCQYSRFMIDLRSNTLIIHLRCSENAINRPIWLPDARMSKTISVAIKLT